MTFRRPVGCSFFWVPAARGGTSPTFARSASRSKVGVTEYGLEG
jgi:hypothetical protein